SCLPLLTPDTGRGRNLLHPCRDLPGVQIILGFELHAAGGFAHRHRRYRGDRLERRAVYEHEFDMAGESAATEAPALAGAIVGHAPFHGALEAGNSLGRESIDTFRDAALGLRQTGDVGEDRLVAGRGLCRACLAGQHGFPQRCGCFGRCRLTFGRLPGRGLGGLVCLAGGHGRLLILRRVLAPWCSSKGPPMWSWIGYGRIFSKGSTSYFAMEQSPSTYETIGSRM